MTETAKGTETPRSRDSIYSKSFILLFGAELFGFAAFYVLLPVIPLYILDLGGTKGQAGLLLAMAGVVSLFTAPILGRLVDRWGRKPMMLTGYIFAALIAASFMLTRNTVSVAFPIMGRFLGSGAANAGSRTLVFDITPIARRGEAISTFVLSHNFAIAFGPALGLFIMGSFGFRAAFLAAASLPLLSFLLVTMIKEPPRPAPAPQATASRAGGWLVPGVLFPSAIMFLLSMSYLSSIQFLGVLGEERGIGGFQFFFTAYAVVVISVRIVSGRISDRYGRASVLIPALAFQTVALIILSQATNLPMLIAVAVFFGMGWGPALPILTAMTADRVDPARRGAALGIFGAASALGSSLGSATVGGVAQLIGFSGSFLFTGSLVFVGLLLCIGGLKASGQLNLQPARPPN